MRLRWSSQVIRLYGVARGRAFFKADQFLYTCQPQVFQCLIEMAANLIRMMRIRTQAERNPRIIQGPNDFPVRMNLSTSTRRFFFSMHMAPMGKQWNSTISTNRVPLQLPFLFSWIATMI